MHRGFASRLEHSFLSLGQRHKSAAYGPPDIVVAPTSTRAGGAGQVPAVPLRPRPRAAQSAAGPSQPAGAIDRGVRPNGPGAAPASVSPMGAWAAGPFFGDLYGTRSAPLTSKAVPSMGTLTQQRCSGRLQRPPSPSLPQLGQQQSEQQSEQQPQKCRRPYKREQ